MAVCSADLSLTTFGSTGQPADHRGGCWISFLPDELLFQIFGYLPQEDHYPLERDRGCLGPGLVCKRWWSVYEPVLFNDISCRDASKNSEHCRQITEILKEKPHLISQVRVLNFSMLKEGGKNEFMDIRSLLETCKGIRTISVAGKLVDKERDGLLFQAIWTLSKIENLTIPYESFSLARQQTEMPFLKHLKLIRESGRNENAKYKQQELEEILPLDRYSTGTVTSIVLSNPALRVGYLSRRILHWPANLLHLSIEHHIKEPQCLQRCIDLHETSLRTIKLGPVFDPVYSDKPTSPLPNFSACVSLEELTLSATNVFNTNGWSNFANRRIHDKLLEKLGPKVHLLTIDFKGFDTWGLREIPARSTSEVDFACFGWFAQRKSKEFPSRNLKKVVVLHDPHKSVSDVRRVWYERLLTRETPWTVWPWEYIARAKEDVEQFGLQLEFESRWSREEWAVIVEKCAYPYDFFADRDFELPGLEWLFPEMV